MILAVAPFLADAAAEMHLNFILFARHKPNIAQLQPVVGELHLPAVHDFLLKNTELIANGKTRAGIVERSQRVHIAGGQPSQAAVAETGIRLHFTQAVKRNVIFGKRL